MACVYPEEFPFSISYYIYQWHVFIQRGSLLAFHTTYQWHVFTHRGSLLAFHTTYINGMRLSKGVPF